MNFMVIIPVAREVRFHSSLFKVIAFTLELFNVIIKPWDLWTINHSPCFKWGKLVQNVCMGPVKQLESASMLSQCMLAQSIEEARSIF